MTALSLQAFKPYQSGGVLPWLAGGVVLLTAIAGGGLLGYWLFLNLVIGLQLTDQPGTILLPPELEVTAEVTNELDVGLTGEIAAEVPFKEILNIPLSGRYDFAVEMAPDIPVQFDVVYDGVIPVDTQANVVATVDFDFETVKKYRNLTFETDIPLQFDLPVNLTAKVNDVIALAYKGPMSAIINDNLRAPVDTRLKTVLPVDENIRTPVNAAIDLRARLPQGPVKVIINRADLRLRPATLQLELAEETDGPRRGDTPWGPQAE